MRFRVFVDPEKCVGRGACVKACAYGVLEIIDDLAYLVEPENCRGCKRMLGGMRSRGNKRNSHLKLL